MDFTSELLGKGANESGAMSASSTPQIKIVTIGVGGAGNNTVNRLVKVGVKGTELVAVNTDVQHFRIVDDRIKKILIGKSMTKGLGAGGDPEVGAKAAEIDRQAIEEVLSGAQLVFLCAGMGGGTGTGAAPIVGRVAKDAGSIVVGIVTIPFSLERVRLDTARKGIDKLKNNVDTLIVIDNQKLVQLYPNLPIEKTFALADEITAKAVRGITEAITQPSLINTDYADVRSIMTGGGMAVISVGSASGAHRVEEVVQNTLKNKLLDVDYSDATGVLLHITGGKSLTLGEANQIGTKLTERSAPNANVIWGARLDPEYGDMIEVIAIFTGVRGSSVVGKDEPRQNDIGLDII